jgi:8-oxo-dGTP pyrophosphatase MutT (NUDIX family)
MSKHLLTTFRIGVYGVLIQSGQVLLTDTKVPSGIITNFPGGGLALGESPVEAVAREFYEETALQVEVKELLYCSRHFQQNSE